jgi:hypothetical protein
MLQDIRLVVAGVLGVVESEKLSKRILSVVPSGELTTE